MQNAIRQTGAVILATVIFLMAAGGAMLYTMSNLSSVTSTTAMLTHNGNQALAAAQSGLKYCLLTDCPDGPTTVTFDGIPCAIDVSDGGCNCGAPAGAASCTITSRAYCPSATDPYRGAKQLSIQAKKTAGIGNCQMIPATRQ